MPLPHLSQDKRCRAQSKRSGVQCLNFSAFGSKVCRFHGAKRPDSIRRGENHPNYRHGNETTASKRTRHDASVVFHRLWDLGVKAKMFEGKLRGRRPV